MAKKRTQDENDIETFKVWIQVEQYIPQSEDHNEEYLELDSRFASSATFYTEAQAQAFAQRLHEYAQNLKEELDEETDVVSGDMP